MLPSFFPLWFTTNWTSKTKKKKKKYLPSIPEHLQSSIYAVKLSGLDPKEVAEQGSVSRERDGGLPAIQRWASMIYLAEELEVKVVGVVLPGHLGCSWRDQFLSLKRGEGKERKIGRRKVSPVVWPRKASKLHVDPWGHPSPFEDSPAELWAYPQAHRLSAHLPQLCFHPLRICF